MKERKFNKIVFKRLFQFLSITKTHVPFLDHLHLLFAYKKNERNKIKLKICTFLLLPLKFTKLFSEKKRSRFLKREKIFLFFIFIINDSYEKKMLCAKKNYLK